jgi:ferrous iron transport protein B
LKESEHKKIVLVGQPNCGKSTLFNRVAGYRSISSNFPGATVSFTQSHIKIGDQTYDLIDLPGIYSLTSFDETANEAQRYLINEPVDVIINVVDASVLARSLDLTLQLLKLNIPMVLCLNMIDEAERKGVIINADALSEHLGIPVIKTIASKGMGIKELFDEAQRMIYSRKLSKPVKVSRDVESIIEEMAQYLEKEIGKNIRVPYRLLAIKLLQGDDFFEQLVKNYDSGFSNRIDKYKIKLEKSHGRPADVVISSELHSLALNIFEECCEIKGSERTLRDKIDNILMHKIWGYFFMVLFLFVFFNLIFKIGGLIEGPFMAFIESKIQDLTLIFNQNSLSFIILKGILQGIGGGVAIVLPYLVPFLLGLAFVEDIGYLPRIAYLMDGLMHRIGLHGSAIIPAILGYGCSVPAVMATRILSSPRDRFIASMVAIQIPCAARMTVIFGLVGYYLGGTAALGIYLFNAIVIALLGNFLSRLMPEDTPGIILEIPPYQLPSLKNLLSKSWLRIKDFIIIAWPLLVIGSAILSIAEYFNFDFFINRLISPLTMILGLPPEVGTTLLFGILRKELSMIMLFQALNTTNVLSALSAGQILVYTIFIIFFIPCVATIGVLGKEIGWRRTTLAVLITFLVALVMSLLARFLSAIIW